MRGSRRKGVPRGQVAMCSRAIAAIKSSSMEPKRGLFNSARSAPCSSPSAPNSDRGEASGSTERRAAPARALRITGSTAPGSATNTIGSGTGA